MRNSILWLPVLLLALIVPGNAQEPRKRLAITPAMPAETPAAEEPFPPLEDPQEPSVMRPALAGGGAAALDAIDDEIITGAIMTEKDMLQYCVNIQDTAREARYAFLQSQMDASEKELEEKLVLLSDRLNEIREYVERREKFLAAVEEKIIGIYASMRPDAAAQQLEELDTGLAASIIAKLDSGVSSKILTEMASRNAAAITQFLSAATRKQMAGKKTQ